MVAANSGHTIHTGTTLILSFLLQHLAYNQIDRWNVANEMFPWSVSWRSPCTKRPTTKLLRSWLFWVFMVVSVVSVDCMMHCLHCLSTARLLSYSRCVQVNDDQTIKIKKQSHCCKCRMNEQSHRIWTHSIRCDSIVFIHYYLLTFTTSTAQWKCQ